MKNGFKYLGLVVVVIIATVLAFVFKKKIEDMIRNIKQIQAKKKENQLLVDLGIPLTYSLDSYNSIANQLYQAVKWNWYSPDCDETGVQKALVKLYTDRDYIELALAFGIRDTYSMETYVQSCLNASEKNWVNQNMV